MKYDILKILKERKEFISGEELGEIFNVSRASIWKCITKLKQDGYNIDSITNKGYLLYDNKDILNSFEVMQRISNSNLWKKCYYFDKVSSTNDEAKIKAFNDEKEGTIIIAEEQYEGKGRQGKSWASARGTGLWMSVILKPNILPTQAAQLTLITGISLCRAIKKSTNLEVYIKWPNDIVINRKKVSGTLTEMSAEIERTKFVIIGIGININTEEFPYELEKKATSLKLETGKTYERREIVSNVLEELENVYLQYIKTNSFVPFKEEYKNLCINMNKDVKLKYKNNEIIAKTIDISDSGELIVKDNNNQNLNIFSGEVSIRLDDNNYI